ARNDVVVIEGRAHLVDGAHGARRASAKLEHGFSSELRPPLRRRPVATDNLAPEQPTRLVLDLLAVVRSVDTQHVDDDTRLRVTVSRTARWTMMRGEGSEDERGDRPHANARRSCTVARSSTLTTAVNGERLTPRFELLLERRKILGVELPF